MKVKIEKILREAFSPDRLAVIDNSKAHAGHEGAKSGGHYEIAITARCFQGKSPVERHRMINQALFAGELKGKIHALSIKALSTDEA